MQLTELSGYAERMGWPAVPYVEKASGKAGSRRPVLDQLLADARLRKFDVVLCWKLDRFGRSLEHIIQNIRTVDAAGIRFHVPSQGIDTDNHSPLGKFMVHILGAFAELERDLIAERVSAGLAEYRRAHKAGEVGKSRHSRSGKDLPHGRPARVFRRDRAVAMRQVGKSWREIAAALGVPQSTIRDLFRSLQA